jgi:hypothetical protein
MDFPASAKAGRPKAEMPRRKAMKAFREIIIASVLLGVWTSTVFAWDRGTRNVSSNGEFSFQVESYGSALPVYNYRGRSYIEGVYGNSYAIRVFNHTARRAEAVVTVDGRDVITGQVGNYKEGRGYVIEPYNSVLIEGFRSSWSNVASFTFTDIGESYAARMGDASNVGVIGVAIFKEKTYRPAPPPPIYRYEEPQPARRQRLGSGYGRSASESPAGAAKSAPSYESREYDRDDSGYAGQGLGTGYGDDTYSPSTSTYFTRDSRRPNTVLAVRYDDRHGLYARGVLPVPQPEPYRYRPQRPEPFPETPTFAPPPPPRWWE